MFYNTKNFNKKFNIRNLAFLALFPGFHLYCMLWNMAVIQPFEKGYLIYANGFSLAVELVLIGQIWLLIKNNTKSAAIIITTSVTLVVIKFLDFAFQNEWLTYYTIVVSVDLIIFLSIIILDLKQKLQKILYIYLITILFVEGFYIKFIGSGINYYSLNDAASYQSVGRAFQVPLIILLCSSDKPLDTFGKWLVGAYILYCFEGRSEFALYVLSSTVLFLLSFRKRIVKIMSPSGILLATSLIGFTFLFIITIIKSDNRIASLVDVRTILDQERWPLTREAINLINQFPLLGSFGIMPAGQAAHNILSVWVDLGLIGFLIWVSMSLIMLLRSVWRYCRLENPTNRIALYFSTFWFFGSIASYWYLSEYYFIMCGFNALAEREHLIRSGQQSQQTRTCRI